VGNASKKGKQQTQVKKRKEKKGKKREEKMTDKRRKMEIVRECFFKGL